MLSGNAQADGICTGAEQHEITVYTEKYMFLGGLCRLKVVRLKAEAVTRKKLLS